MPKETHSNDSSQIECPCCEEAITGLWDYGMEDDERLDTECPSCEKPITLSCRISVHYTCKPTEKEPT